MRTDIPNLTGMLGFHRLGLTTFHLNGVSGLWACTVLFSSLEELLNSEKAAPGLVGWTQSLGEKPQTDSRPSGTGKTNFNFDWSQQ